MAKETVIKNKHTKLQQINNNKQTSKTTTNNNSKQTNKTEIQQQQ